ncbi:hypothetical protein FPE01S_06_00300 [Flavihumibacter petaseus NBRC 106054]|uniref:RNA polymerase ECF-type sigma factor n=1 Tax=Flavihumibacter petaseus NBRC 106054 TaxID=1220578 RepID=A0A0E9N6T5_9BACT|nr:hypothetical protein FPE01S_06_00300 [Flavihumibacter petaseus NBRC 106054]
MNAPLKLNAALKRAAVGDRTAQELLFHQYYPFAGEIAARYDRPERSASVLAVQSFRELFRQLKTFDPNTGSFKTFFKRIIVDTATRGLSIVYIPTVLPSMAAWSSLRPDQVLVRLHDLPPAVHAILLLTAVEGFTDEEIIDRLKVSGDKNRRELKQLTAYIRPYETVIRQKISSLPGQISPADEQWEQLKLFPPLPDSHAGIGSVEAATIQPQHEKPLEVERQWTGWAFLIFLIAASLLMLFWSGLFEGTRVPIKKPAKSYERLER